MRKFSKRVVTFGGGTGQYHLLSGLRELNDTKKITAVAGIWDSGGSSGRLRTELGVLPPGDIRQCLLALMEDETQRKVAQRLFDDHLEEKSGPMKGHSLGNLITARLDHIYRGQDRGMQAARALFRIEAKVLPVSLTRVDLFADLTSGRTVEGETNIDLRGKSKKFDKSEKISKIYFDTRVEANPEVLKAIKGADKIVFSAGDFYTSILPHLLVDGISEAINKSKAEVIFVLNLADKAGETDGYSALDFLKVVSYYLENDKRVDKIIVDSSTLDKGIVKLYESEGQSLVSVNEKEVKKIFPKVKIVKKPVSGYLKKEHLLRHDPIKLAREVLKD